jgi:prevent-host-death family protein
MRTFVRMGELSTNQKGVIAETAIELAAARAEVGVYRPTSGHSRADLLFEIGDDLYRVQVKWGNLSAQRDVITVSLSGSRYSPKGYVYSRYAEHELDLFAVYCGDLDRCFLLPIGLCANRRAIFLRLSPPRNNQRACINLADQYAFEGAVAQLGERRAGSAKVRGSSPLSSTSSPPALGPAVVVGVNTFRDHLGEWMDRVAAGEEVILTRHGTPRIRLLPAVAPLPQAA